MTLAVLVLHGPNLASLAEAQVDGRLRSKAEELEVTLSIFQKNGEEGLLDVLHAHAGSHDAVLVNPGVLAPNAFALAEGLAQLALPAVEVLLTRPLSKSALTGAVLRQVHGEGVEGYERALEQLIGEGVRTRGGGAGVKRAAGVKKGKTIGRRVGKEFDRPTVAMKSMGRGGTRTTDKLAVTRAQVRERIKDRLRGTLGPAALMTWARETWAQLQAGALAEPGHEAVIDSVLLALMTPRPDDAGLISLMARLDT
ncbi:MAG: type II 3-dehydroquinate dehydratase [Archangium sp.]